LSEKGYRGEQGIPPLKRGIMLKAKKYTIEESENTAEKRD